MTNRLKAVELDHNSTIRLNAVIEMEKNQALDDLIATNNFDPVDCANISAAAPLHLNLRLDQDILIFKVREVDGQHIERFQISLTPFRRIVKEYFQICESYFSALQGSNPRKIEAIDMGRRGIHNEAAAMLQERLKTHVDVDINTARRLFTLICVLHIRA